MGEDEHANRRLDVVEGTFEQTRALRDRFARFARAPGLGVDVEESFAKSSSPALALIAASHGLDELAARVGTT